MTVSLIGKRVGNYDIQSKLGEGGMGAVYLGLHPQIGKKVAIKVLHEELSSKADVVTRFFNEARSVNDINHANIVDIVDFGETVFEGINFKYIIMEFLDGESVSARIRREGVTIRETMHIVSQCASALAASHGKGVVHRDLKPENVYLCTRANDRNYVKVLDFGIAKLTADTGPLSQKTRTGMVIGTPAYMSPEQCEGKGNIDHRSDIYALGVVMYELLAGRVPFPGEGFGEVLVAHLTREPEPPSSVNANVPPEIDAIVMHCLRKDRAQRFQSMEEMLGALENPQGHYQQWVQSAQVPAGVITAGAGMSTVLLGNSGSSSYAPPGQSHYGPAPAGASGAMWGAVPSMQQLQPIQAQAGWQQLSGAQPMVSVDPQALRQTGMGQRPGTSQFSAPQYAPQQHGGQSPAFPMPGPGFGPAADVLTQAPPQGPRPTTLSGTAGERASAGRRPVNVLIGFVGAMAIGVLSVVGVKAGHHTDEPVGTAVQPPKGGGPLGTTPQTPMVTVTVNSEPAGAEVSRSDVLEGQPHTTPYAFKVKKGAAKFDIKLRLDGFVEETRNISTDVNNDLSITLSKVAPRKDEPPVEQRPEHRHRTTGKTEPAAPPDGTGEAGADGSSKHHHRHGTRKPKVSGKPDGDNGGGGLAPVF